MPSSITKTSAQVEIGRRHPYAVLFGLKMLGAAVALALLAGVAFGARWLFGHLGHLSAPSVSIPTPNGSGVAFGWVAAAVVGSVVITLLVRRIVRHIRYGV